MLVPGWGTPLACGSRCKTCPTPYGEKNECGWKAPYGEQYGAWVVGKARPVYSERGL